MEPLEYVTTRRMTLASNKLQDACYVHAVAFDPPVDGGAEGLLHVRCSTEADYLGIRRFLEEEHGSALQSGDGGVWYVHRIDDDVDLGRPFPQQIRIRVEWRYRA